MNLYAYVTGYFVTTGDVVVVGANGNRVGLIFTASAAGGTFAHVSLDGSQLVGVIDRTYNPSVRIGVELGDLPSRRFSVVVDNGSAGAVVGVIEIISTSK